MSSTSPNVSTHNDNVKRSKRVKMQNMSVAERLKMSRSKFRSSEYFEDDGDEVLQYVEDGPIPEQDLDLKKYDKAAIRVIAQYLDGLGLKETVDKLVEESGCTVENSNAAKLRLAIQHGKYDSALHLIDKCFPKYLSSEEIDEAKFQIEMFKLADLLKRKLLVDAIFASREVAERIHPSKSHRLETLNAFMKEMFSDKSKFENVRLSEMRTSQIAALQGILPTSFILPANRLKHILGNVHGSTSDDKADLLLNDEKKIDRKKQAPECVQVLTDHASEVHMVKFSTDGKYLATGSKSNHIILWQINDGRVFRLRRFEAIQEGLISCMEWSPGNQFLAVCGTAQCKYNLTVFDVFQKCIHRQIRVQTEDMNIGNMPYYFTCCAFFSSKIHQSLICANEHGLISIYNLLAPAESQPVKQIKGFRVRCVYGMKDGVRILTADTHNRVRQYRMDNEYEVSLFQEEVPIITFTVHPSEQLVLTTTSLNLRLWDLKSRTLIRYFSGACQGDDIQRYVIHASFGGQYHGYIATGTIGEPTTNGYSTPTTTSRRNTENDGRVLIWNLDDGRPMLKLKGHHAQVNATSWNPTEPSMLASCSDDGTVRIWQLDAKLSDKPSSCLPRRVPRQKLYAREHRQMMADLKWKEREVHKNGSGSSSTKKTFPTFHTNIEYEKEIVTYPDDRVEDCTIA